MSWDRLVGLAQRSTQQLLTERSTYVSQPGAPGEKTGSVRVAFEALHVPLGFLDGLEVGTLGPAVGVLLAELPGSVALKGDSVTVRGETYTVHAVEEDGQGGAWLRLHEAE